MFNVFTVSGSFLHYLAAYMTVLCVARVAVNVFGSPVRPSTLTALLSNTLSWQPKLCASVHISRSCKVTRKTVVFYMRKNRFWTERYCSRTLQLARSQSRDSMRSYKHIRQHLWRWTSLFVLTIATRNPSCFHWSLLWAIRNKESSPSSSNQKKNRHVPANPSRWGNRKIAKRQIRWLWWKKIEALLADRKRAVEWSYGKKIKHPRQRI